MGSYELPLPETAPAPEQSAQGRSASFPRPLLVRNVLWFCRLRWIVVAILAAFGAASFLPGAFARLGLRPRVYWPSATAAVLAAANLGFLAHARRLARRADAADARASLWAQIVLDLLVLTAVVHYLGSLETYAAFAYLFHIVLACIFFPRALSFVVVAVAGGLFVLCVLLEGAGAPPPATIYAGPSLRSLIDRTPGAALLNMASAVGIWVVVWYLASHLSALVLARDNALAETNRLLVEAEQEKARHMLRTTHELKTPFAAIHANAQLLLRGHCGALPDPALEVARRIARRCRRLATEIQEMLQLANLRSPGEVPLPQKELDLADVLRWSIAQVRVAAEERSIAIEEDIEPARTVGVEDHLKMLFTNLLSNAVSYSYDAGRVRVGCSPTGGNGPAVTIEDEGIGIAPEKLPRIFDEYYRTDEAAQHNKESTGLGLAIVKSVAGKHGIRVRVDSGMGAGTRLTLRFPIGRTDRSAAGAAERR
jgi:signal transduction histidine kinase